MFVRRARPRHLPSVPFEPLEARTLLALLTWDGGPTGLGTDWHNPVNWDTDTLPVDGDSVLLGPGPAVEFTTGNLSLVTIQSDRPLAVRGGSLLASTASIGDQFTLDGGAIGGGSWIITGAGLIATDNPANTLDTATITGDITLAADSAFLRITNDLTLNGLLMLSGDDACLSFDANAQTLSGLADVRFFGFVGHRYLSADNSAILTIAPTVRITGNTGKLVSGRISGSGAIINQGTIWSDVDGGSLDILPATFSNLGILRSSGFGYLRIAAGLWTNSGLIATAGGNIVLAGSFDTSPGIGLYSRGAGEIFIEGDILNANSSLTLSAATGLWRFRGGRISGGSVSATPSGGLADYPLSSGKLTNVSLAGAFTWQSSGFSAEFDAVTLTGALTFGSFSTLTIRNTLTLDGTLTLTGADSLLAFAGAAQSILGTAAIRLENEDARLWAFEPLTIPAAVSISGFGRILGDITNHGSITADTPGKSLIIGGGVFQNEATVSATAGRLWFGEPAGAAATFINNATITATGASTIAIGPTLDTGPVLFTNAANMSLSGTAVLTVGRPLAARPVTLQNSGTLTLSGTAHATIGSLQAFIPIVLDNTGLITVTAGAELSFDSLATTAQIGDLRAAGGLVIIRGDIDNANATIHINAQSGSWIVDGGGFFGGEIAFADGAQLIFNSNVNNLFHAVTLTGAFALSQPGARLAISGGLTLAGTFSITGQNTAVRFLDGSQSIDGSGSILFSGTLGNQTLSIEGGHTLTITPNITLSGNSGAGTISPGPGGGSIINQGTIAGKLSISATVSNAGLIHARNGHTLTFSGPFTNLVKGTLSGGQYKVSAGSTLNLGGPITTNLATITLEGKAASWPALSSLTRNASSLTITNSASLALTANFINAASLTLGPAAALSAPSFINWKVASLTFTIGGQGAPSLTTTGAAGVYGDISITWASGFTPSAGTFALVAAASLHGTFKSIAIAPPGAGLIPILLTNPTTLSLALARLTRA